MMIISLKKRREKLVKDRKNEGAKADLSEDGYTYVIDCLNKDKAANDSESSSKWMLAQHSKIWMAYK